ncbi:MAG: UDP-N-acetylmuramoyl-L-alanyl-D-glutamate--2,6-diaminopimelate ligase, partial [Alphaproteobacteria bacterium]|nr:UDP-N-acetylmuramoyl-L-alanyl-D-glutamate--2,6-diaminopimelate ligase [Alphaproteobacteria bacterium]
TDDNPRTEEPAAIRAEILAGCDDAHKVSEADNRRAAIEESIGQLGAGDILVIAGKGHETGQIVGDTELPFDDAAVAAECLAHTLRGAA